MHTRHFLLALALLSGCAHVTSSDAPPRPGRKTTRVDSIARASAARRYFLLPAVEGVGPNDLLFQEYAGHLEGALAEKGYKRVASLEEAELLLLLSYGVGAPNEEVVTKQAPSVHVMTASPTDGPRYIFGRQTQSHVEVTHKRYFFVTAYEAAAVRAGTEPTQVPQVWQTLVTNTGPDADLRRAFPVMVKDAKRLFGVNTRGEVEAPLDETKYAIQ